jgi:hypothetical protein
MTPKQSAVGCIAERLPRLVVGRGAAMAMALTAVLSACGNSSTQHLDAGLADDAATADADPLAADAAADDAALAGTAYHVATTGDDVNGDGSADHPWKTLFHACGATTDGDLIELAAGTYDETQSCELPVGVSIVGTGVASCHLNYTYPGTSLSNAAIKLASPDGTDGHQTISSIDLGGTALTSTQGILVLGRSNVKVHDIAIHDFLGSGIYFQGANQFGPACPVVMATGNELYNFVITNNSDRTVNGIANVVVSGFDGMLIHDGTITQTARPVGHNGDNFVIPSVVRGGFSCAAGLKYYNVKSYRNSDDGNASDFQFHMELWDCQGGMEIYNNEFHGGGQQIDLAGTDTTSRSFELNPPYTYNWYIHDNLFQWEDPVPSFPAFIPVGVDIESDKQWVTIANNHFKNVPFPVTMSLNSAALGQKNITIEDNLFEHSGFANGEFAFDISVIGGGLGTQVNNLHIYNNTIANTNARAAFYFIPGNGDTLVGTAIINNIVQGVPPTGYGYLTFKGTSGTIDGFVLKNNLLFDNVASNQITLLEGAALPTNLVTSEILVGDPLFLSTTDFHLQPGSPALEAGLDVGLPFSGAAPNIGAF